MGNLTSKGKNSVYCSLPSQRIISYSSSLGVSLMILLDFEIGFPDVSARYSSGNDSFCASTRACVHDCNTRYKNNLNISAYKSASGQRTFLYRAMSFWNSLPRA